MHNNYKTYLNWSSGKDAMLALHQLRNGTEHSIEKLVTTINTDFDRVSMHGTPVKLLQQQAKQLQIPLHLIPLKGNVSLNSYNQAMQKHTELLKSERFTHTVFGDIFLEDLKEYRENQLKKSELTPVFPLWKKDTKTLIQEFIQLGYKAVVTCTNAKVLDASFCGRIIDQQFLDDLPKQVDPCGENGEFHTFVFDGPLFSNPVSFELGKKVLRNYSSSEGDDCFDKNITWDNSFWYIDLIS